MAKISNWKSFRFFDRYLLIKMTAVKRWYCWLHLDLSERKSAVGKFGIGFESSFWLFVSFALVYLFLCSANTISLTLNENRSATAENISVERSLRCQMHTPGTNSVTEPVGRVIREWIDCKYLKLYTGICFYKFCCKRNTRKTDKSNVEDLTCTQQ